MRGISHKTPDGRGIDLKLEAMTQELGPGESGPQPSISGGRIRFSAPAPVKGYSAHSVEWEGHTYPERLHAIWIRQADGLVVEMEVRTDSIRGPVALWFLVRPPDGVLEYAHYHPPIREMAKQAARSHGYEPLTTWSQERHLINADRQHERLVFVASCDTEAKEKGLQVAEYTQAQLLAHGFGELSRSRIWSLRSEARKVGLMERRTA